MSDRRNSHLSPMPLPFASGQVYAEGFYVNSPPVAFSSMFGSDGALDNIDGNNLDASNALDGNNAATGASRFAKECEVGESGKSAAVMTIGEAGNGDEVDRDNNEGRMEVGGLENIWTDESDKIANVEGRFEGRLEGRSEGRSEERSEERGLARGRRASAGREKDIGDVYGPTAGAGTGCDWPTWPEYTPDEAIGADWAELLKVDDEVGGRRLFVLHAIRVPRLLAPLTGCNILLSLPADVHFQTCLVVLLSAHAR
ncbi:unnamed protein product [Closterium sp. Yama58-4]|nr:unnamed protein product [Closterium sp. Yama58-4]